MIKVLFFIETLEGGGAEKVLRDLVDHMDLTRFDVTVMTVWPSGAARSLAPGVRYRSMYPSRSRFNSFRYRLEAACGLAYRLHIRPNSDIECAYLEMGSTKVISASTNKKAKKLAWVHCDLTRAVSDTKAFAEKTALWYDKFDRVICVSQTVKDRFDELFCGRFDTDVIYNVIDDAAIREKAKLPLPDGVRKKRFTVLSVGRFTAQKRFTRLLKAHKRLLDEGLEHDVWILGEGPERPMLERFVTDNGLSDSVLMPGFVQNPYPFMREADLLACSSIYEGYSTFMTEGVILGKPIVTTDVSGMRELLGASEYGLIVGDDDEEFYCGLKRMLADAGSRDKYAQSASARGMDFSADKLTDATERFFEELLNQ
ncbi:MAG: glycosyltransferase [Clostridia bacterium]|nr:glycosyltransferase [Clostridia bacterium]